MGQLPPSAFCEVVALACDVAYSDYALGFTKLFLRAGKGVFLEELLAMDITEVIPLLEQKIREWERRQKAIKTVGYCVLGWYRRVRLKKQKGAAGTIGRWWRGGIARKNCRKLAKAKAKERAAKGVREAEEAKIREKAKIMDARAEAQKASMVATVTKAQAETAKEVERREQAEATTAALTAQLAALTAQNEQLRGAAEGGDKAEKKLAEALKTIDELREQLKAGGRKGSGLGRGTGASKDLMTSAALRMSGVDEKTAALLARLEETKLMLATEKTLAEQLRAELESEREMNDQLSEELLELREANPSGSLDRALGRMSMTFGAPPPPATHAARHPRRARRRATVPARPALFTTAERTRSNLFLYPKSGKMGSRVEYHDELESQVDDDEIEGDRRLQVEITRDEESGTLGVDIDEWRGYVTVGVIVPDSPAAGLLAVGDVIEAVGGVNCHNDMNEVLKQIISAGDNVKLLVRRPALVTLLRHDVLLRAPDGTDAWGECSATLFNTRQLVLEPLSGRGTPHEVNVRSVVHLELQEAMFNLPPTLSVWTSGDEVIALRCEAPEHEGVRGGAAVLHAFYEELRQMVQSAEELGLDEGEPSLARQNTMVWQQGWLEMSVGIDEWSPRFLRLSSKHGLLVFFDQAAARRGEPERTIPFVQIIRAMRAPGLEYFENGVIVQLLEDHDVELRAPSHNDMMHWLSTLNMHCIAPRQHKGSVLASFTGVEMMAMAKQRGAMPNLSLPPRPESVDNMDLNIDDGYAHPTESHLKKQVNPAASPAL